MWPGIPGTFERGGGDALKPEDAASKKLIRLKRWASKSHSGERTMTQRLNLFDSDCCSPPKLSRFVGRLLRKIDADPKHHIIRIEQKSLPDLIDLPKVTFAIPTYNSQDTIVPCLSSIESQDYPRKEIIIVDGYSRDSTVKLAAHYSDKILFCDGPLGMCRQMGFENSSGEIVAMFDSDLVIPHKNWLRLAVAKFLAGPDVSTVWPVTVAPCNASGFSRAFNNFAWAFMLEESAKGTWVGGGGHSLFRRSLVEQVGGIDVSIHYGEDFYLAGKLARHGYKVVIDEDPLYHLSHSSLGEWLAKERQRTRNFRETGYYRLTGIPAGHLVGKQLRAMLKSVTMGSIMDGDPSWFLVLLLMLIRTVTAFEQIS